MMRFIRSRLARFVRAEAGTATVEFVILFPVFMMLTVSAIEMAVLTLRQVMLERGIDITVRALRVGSMTNPTFDSVKEAICENTVIIHSCTEVIHLELTPISTTSWGVPENSVGCVDRTGTVEPVVNFDQGARNEFMLMRACAVFTPMFPTYGLGAQIPVDSSGGYHVIAATSFVNEP